ncbi:MAG TPA: ABC transporter permease, partial [Bryobacteraceae bacterium]|nr:ABC transporter permease [Bryobacteraceae bacterium]
MPLPHTLKALWRNLLRRQQVEEDLDAELRSYRDMLQDELVRKGADPALAARQALVELGGAEQIKEQVRDIRRGAALEAIWSELRHSFRGLRRNPGLTIVATLMLALGMGSSITVFSIFQAALLKPLPFRDSARLLQIWETRKARGLDQTSFSEANFWDVRAQNRSFEELAAYRSDEANLTGAGPAEKVAIATVTAGLFRTLGVAPVLGRDFTYDDDRAGWDNHVVLIGHRYWRARFGGDRSILGRTLRLNDRAYTVVGVLPPAEPWLTDQLYIPFGYTSGANRGSWEFDVIGRLAPGVSAAAARADLERIGASLSRTYPAEDRGIGFRVESSSAWVAGDNTRLALWVLLGAVTFLLLIACLNIANLLLARGSARRREIAVRTALGAGRARLVRFVVMESLVLSSLGAAAGVALASCAVRLLQGLELGGIPRLQDAGLNPWVLGYAVVLALAAGGLSGLAPAFQVPASGIAATLRDGDRQTGSRAQGRLRATLVTAEVALSFLL